jgi:UDP-2,3-diacylglucosamine pyrophosphatase LpxH
MKIHFRPGRTLSAILFFSAFGWLCAQTIQPIPNTGTLQPTKDTSFKFIVAGDNRPPDANSPQPATPSIIMAAAKKDGAAFIVWTGDIIYGLDSADPSAIGKQYDEFFKIAAKAGVPVFVAPGNHEMDVKVKHSKGGLKEIGSQQMEDLYRANMKIAPGGAIYGAFSYGNAEFILLNSEEIAPAEAVRSPGPTVTDSKKKSKVNLDPGYISPTQMDWITKELAANHQTHTFIFMHHPIKPLKSSMGLNQANADALVKLFAQYSNISYVMASHEHLYYNPQGKDSTAQPPKLTSDSKDKPYYLVSGGAGAPLDTGSQGAFHNYLLVSVNGGNVDVTMNKLDDGNDQTGSVSQ